jgi:hypothetical protein
MVRTTTNRTHQPRHTTPNNENDTRKREGGVAMTPEERQAEINRNKAIQGLARSVLHDPDMRADVRQAARDTAVQAHTALHHLEGGK